MAHARGRPVKVDERGGGWFRRAHTVDRLRRTCGGGGLDLKNAHRRTVEADVWGGGWSQTAHTVHPPRRVRGGGGGLLKARPRPHPHSAAFPQVRYFSRRPWPPPFPPPHRTNSPLLLPHHPRLAANSLANSSTLRYLGERSLSLDWRVGGELAPTPSPRPPPTHMTLGLINLAVLDLAAPLGRRLLVIGLVLAALAAIACAKCLSLGLIGGPAARSLVRHEG